MVAIALISLRSHDILVHLVSSLLNVAFMVIIFGQLFVSLPLLTHLASLCLKTLFSVVTYHMNIFCYQSIDVI